MLHELFISDEFSRYQKQQMKVMTDVIWSQLQQKPEQAAGAITLAVRLLNLPKKLSETKDVQAITREVIDKFKVSFIQLDDI